MSEPLYWCLLDEQPHYLVPPSAIAAQCLDGLVVDPGCRVSWQDETADAERLDDVESFLPAHCVAWVPDVATGATWPYWIGYQFIDSVVALSTGRVDPAALSPAVRWVLAQAGIIVRPETLEPRRIEARRRAAWSRQQFRKGFAPMQALLPPFHLAAMRRYYRQCVRAGSMRLGDGQVDRRFVSHNEPVARFIQRQLTPAVSALAGRAVKPSYAYVTACQGGALLERHTDRPQCEYTLSICLDFVPETSGTCPWSINLDVGNRTLRILQRPGEGLLFRGRRIVHHRDKLASRSSVTNVLLHYVDAGFAGSLE
jgi:hypothetical protein